MVYHFDAYNHQIRIHQNPKNLHLNCRTILIWYRVHTCINVCIQQSMYVYRIKIWHSNLMCWWMVNWLLNISMYQISKIFYTKYIGWRKKVNIPFILKWKMKISRLEILSYALSLTLINWEMKWSLIDNLCWKSTQEKFDTKHT